ncbi:CHAT domain-containing protein [Leptothermofonsia sichuanensis E412]|nr:CHAT domain-containing protein [Leptothermofonsia sichuanensis E412]
MQQVMQKMQGNYQTTRVSRRWLTRISCFGLALAIAGFSALPVRSQTLSEKVLAMERGLAQEFEAYFGESLAEVTQTPDEITQTLQRIGQKTGTRPAVLWVIPRGDHLHLVLLTPAGKPIVRDLYEVPTSKLRPVVDALHLEMHSSAGKAKMAAAQQLYEWIIQPFEADYLQAEGIDTLLFCLGNGVRSLPLAALHDGQQFLLEKYSMTRIPAFNLIQTDYVRLQPGQILAMGASEFRDHNPLPAVPTELSNILWELQSARPARYQWKGQSFLNQSFTFANLQQMVQTHTPTVVHLATHAVFRPGKPSNSYIQLWDTRLGLDNIRQIDWGSPLELLVLSACRTAIGDDQAELGFAGVALKSNVKSVLASLWNVSDEGTLALMSEFYRQLGTTPTKAEALRQAQLRMLRGEIRIEGKQLVLSRGPVSLPTELGNETVSNFSAPYYWAAFTLISSPW